MGQSVSDGFDCSGFVSFVLRSAGLFVPDYIGQDGTQRSIRHANEYWDKYGILVHDNHAQPADLIFFSRNGQFPTHIGIVLNKENYIHSPGIDNSKVEVCSINRKSIEHNQHGVIYSRNPIGFKSPVIATQLPTYRYHQKMI